MKISMYTQSNAYLRKTSSSLLLALLLFSALVAILPMAVVHGSTGHPDLGTVSNATTLTGFVPAASYVNITAGSNVAGLDCGAAFPASCTGGVSGFFAINFSSGGMLFSGSQYSLYLSKDGFSQISAADIHLAGGLTDNHQFSVTQTYASAVTSVTEKNGTFYIGNNGVLSGPLPIKISNAYKYIKIFDGSATSVAVTKEAISIMPGLKLTPTTGPAGTPVTAIGGGFPLNTVIDLVYSYAFTSWSGVITYPIGNWTTGVNTAKGFFNSTAPMIDSKQVYNPSSGLQTLSYVNILAKYEAKPHALIAAATFDEITRLFVGVKSYNSGGGELYFQTNGPYGNDTGYCVDDTCPNLAQPIPVNVKGTVNIAGNNSLVNTPVTFWIGTTQILPKTPATTNGRGYYNATITVPILPAGITVLKVINNGVTYEFTIDVLPTLVLTPNNGTVGTHITATAYGFPANTMFYLYWYQYSYYSYDWYQVAHGTTGADGTFNVTVAFNVPHAYGGGHDVAATSTNLSISANNPPGTVTATTTFTVTATLVICNGSTCKAGETNANTISINSNVRLLLSAVGTGLYPNTEYWVTIDNAFNVYIYTSYTGDTFMNFTAAGFAPGLHQVEVYNYYYCDGPNYCGTPESWAYFNVTTIGAYTGGGGGTGSLNSTTLTNINTNVNTILDKVNTILGWQSTIFGMNENIGTINTNVNTINTHVGTILGWQSTIVNINSTVNGLKTTLATMTGTLTTIIGDINSATTAANAAKTSADAASTAATNAHNSVSDTTTYVLVVAVLAAITLVLELAILVRKLD